MMTAELVNSDLQRTLPITVRATTTKEMDLTFVEVMSVCDECLYFGFLYIPTTYLVVTGETLTIHPGVTFGRRRFVGPSSNSSVLIHNLCFYLLQKLL